MLQRKCANQEPSEEGELEADKYTNHIEAYSPVGNLVFCQYVNSHSTCQ